MFKWLKNRAEKRQIANNLYFLATTQAGNPKFYHSYQVTDSISGRYEILCLHVYLLLERLRHEDYEKQVSALITELLIEDLSKNYHDAAPKDYSASEKINMLIAGFYQRSAEYETGLRKGKKERLTKAINTHIFHSKLKADERSENIANYMIAVYNYLSSMPFKDIGSAEFIFLDH